MQNPAKIPSSGLRVVDGAGEFVKGKGFVELEGAEFGGCDGSEELVQDGLVEWGDGGCKQETAEVLGCRRMGVARKIAGQEGAEREMPGIVQLSRTGVVPGLVEVVERRRGDRIGEVAIGGAVWRVGESPEVKSLQGDDFLVGRRVGVDLVGMAAIVVDLLPVQSGELDWEGMGHGPGSIDEVRWK